LFVTEDQAAEMYARACRGWYGARAQSVVGSKIQALKAKGDHEGVEAWRRVARALVRRGKSPMTSRERHALVSELLKTRHGIDVCRRRVAQVVNANPMIDEKMTPHDIAILIKSHL